MIEIENIEKERAFLIALKTRDISKEAVMEHLDELEMLADTAGAETLLKVIQERNRIDPAYYIGKGKAEEIAELVELNDVRLVLFDDDLTQTQVRNLEKLIDRKIVDRSGLILDIFASHAKTRESKTQVELAQLQYLLPRLTRAWTHLSKQYGGIGTKGPGETQIETDRRIIRTRIAKLKERLAHIETQRIVSSSKRKNFINVSLVGYTNAGKSTLLNRLTGASVLAENKLFATLDSTTRLFELNGGRSLILSDTVGFIRKLPHNLIASFKSTLNVVRDADIILHIIDVSHPYFEEHIRVVESTLEELNSEKKERLTIFNKVDILTDKTKINYIQNKFPEAIMISAERGINIKSLIERLNEIVAKNHVEETIKLNLDESKKLSQIHQLAEVLSVKYNDDKVIIRFKTDTANREKIKEIADDERIA